MALGGLAPTPSLRALAINVLHMPLMQAHWARLHLSAVERVRDSNGNDVSSPVSSSLPVFMPTLQAIAGPSTAASPAIVAPICSGQWAPVGRPSFHPTILLPNPRRQSNSPLSLPWAISFLSPASWKSLVRPLSLSGGGIISSWRCLIYPKPRCRRPGFEKVSPFVVPPPHPRRHHLVQENGEAMMDVDAPVFFLLPGCAFLLAMSSHSIGKSHSFTRLPVF